MTYYVTYYLLYDIHGLEAEGVWSRVVPTFHRDGRSSAPKVGVNAVEAARLATATLPIFRPVNKLREQMDLRTKMHSAPLQRLELSLADLF